jgi:hypothetical protein
MQDAMDLLGEYLTFYGFEAGHAKCAYQHINTVGEQQPLSLQNKPIPHLHHDEIYKYLGGDLSLSLDWTAHQKRTLEHAKNEST